MQCASIEDSKFPAEFSDAVLLNQTLEHLYSPAAAIRRSYEILRPSRDTTGGGPKFDSWPRYGPGKLQLWAHLDLPRHLHHFRQPVLLKLIQDAGFGVREVRLSSRPITLYFTFRTLQDPANWNAFSRAQGEHSAT